MPRLSKPAECHNCESRPNGIFCELEQASTRELEQRKTSNVYKKGQIIFYEGNQALGLYCVSSGRVKLYKTSIDGKEQIVRIASPGDVLGYRALLADEPYHATAEALEDAEVCCLDRNAFFPLLKKEPSLAMNLIQKLAQELRVAENLAATIAQKSVRERMAELLLTLKEVYGKKMGTISVLVFN
ncbi:MAG: Crp/Fnr family transcriptional regulator [Deltaproteobacteria bacterium]|nr:MAG: Crp/Fnr family transcriptional regulator [Deltaproteobacteria bacterium]